MGLGETTNGASVIVGLGDCRLLLKHLAKPDVNFKAGYDVRGGKIKVADYDDGLGLKLEDTVTFDIGIDIANKYNLGQRNMTAMMTMVNVTIKNGQVFLNNQLITKKDGADLETRCQSILNLK
jgi:carbohydrate-binding DOMON domain-containing protein